MHVHFISLKQIQSRFYYNERWFCYNDSESVILFYFFNYFKIIVNHGKIIK